MNTNNPRNFEVEWLVDYIERHELKDRMYHSVLDIGAGDGEYCSNSNFFIKEWGFAGILVDGLISNSEKCREVHKDNDDVYCFAMLISDKYEEVRFEEDQYHWSVSRIQEGEPNRQTNRLADLVAKLNLHDIGIFSLDIEGLDTRVIKHMMEETDFRPQFIIVEGNTLDDMKEQREYLESEYKFIGGVFPNQIFRLKDESIND